MKRPLSWHKQNLLNMRYSLHAAEARVELASKDRDKIRQSLALAEEQIALAETRGLTEYDNERLGIKRVR